MPHELNMNTLQELWVSCRHKEQVPVLPSNHLVKPSHTMSSLPSDPPAPKLVHDFTKLTQVQHMELALAALVASGTKPNRNPNLSIWKTATQYEIPQSTLTDWWNGTPTRKEGHAHKLLLTAAQEDVLVEWVKVMGRQGIPLNATSITDYVADIAGRDVGESWVRHFNACHPDLKVKWSATLEKWRATSLNPALVNEFYDLLEDTIKRYNIPPENIYNMDEKGIQLSIGQKVKAFVDHDQKDCRHVAYYSPPNVHIYSLLAEQPCCSVMSLLV